MNEGQALVLGRRAKRCARWQWAPGMRTVTHARVVQADTDGRVQAARKGYFGDWSVLDLDAEEVPDLRDSATLGCLLALVRDAWPTVPATTARFTYHSPERGPYSGWACTYWRPDDSVNRGAWIQAQGETEIEALVAALEAAGARERGEEDGK